MARYLGARKTLICTIAYMVCTTIMAAFVLCGPACRDRVWLFAPIWGVGFGVFYAANNAAWTELVPPDAVAQFMALYYFAAQILKLGASLSLCGPESSVRRLAAGVVRHGRVARAVAAVLADGGGPAGEGGRDPGRLFEPPVCYTGRRSRGVGALPRLTEHNGRRPDSAARAPSSALTIYRCCSKLIFLRQNFCRPLTRIRGEQGAREDE